MKRILWLSVFAFLAVFLVFDPAQALRITLKRIIFEEGRRAEVITIINNTADPQTYRLGWSHFRMSMDKGLTAVPDDQLTGDIKPVVDMVRFAPRRFTVAPGSSQQVRMMLRMPADLPDGEYRSHFSVQPEADVEKDRAKAIKRNKAHGSSGGVSMTMLAGVTMPVIVRKGNLTADVSLVDFDAVGSGGFITTQFSLMRSGDRSVYGDLYFTCNPEGGSYPLKELRGIAIYTEVEQRNFSFRIEKPLDRPPCRALSVSFTEVDGFVGAPSGVLAEAVVTVR